MKLGDTVRGEYMGTMIEGVIHAYDGSGCIYVTPAKPVEILGKVRDSLCFDRHDRHALRLVKSAPALESGDVHDHGYAMMGLMCLASWKPVSK